MGRPLPMFLLCMTMVLPAGPAFAPLPIGNNPPAKVAVTIDNFSFSPATVTVASGTTVVWTNQDDVPHTVTSNENVFGSSALDTGEKFEFTFKKAGTFSYYCKVHPKMTGKVVVQ